jgi:hypothetical protein
VLESSFQAKLIKRLRRLFPGAIILRNDAGYMQGVPDLTILYGPRWAALEVKASADARERPNQRYYVDKWDEMSFAAFIYPENEDEVLHALQQAFAAEGDARLSQR